MFTLDVFGHSLSADWPLLAAAFALGALTAGWLVLGLLRRRLAAQSQAFEQERQSLQQSQRWYEERDRLRQDLHQQFSDRFAAVSAEALQRNNDVFLRLAEQRFQRLQQNSGEDLRQRQQAIEALLTPIRDVLGKTEAQIREIEKERRESFGALSQHLQSLASAQARLQDETHNLVNALRRPEIRGQWGELTLKRLVELAGMVEHCDFNLQPTLGSDSGALRPDMVVTLPGQRQIVVDAKTPLDAYLSATRAESASERERQLDRHAAQLGQRIRELAAKQYWAQFQSAPEFVVLFIPGEQFLAAALDRRPQMLEQALQQKVILATPGSLIALLKTVAFGWRQQAVADNAERIQQVGEQLHQRIATFSEHLARLGRSLAGGLDHYNAAIGSLERQLLPAVRRLEEMGIQSAKPVTELEPVVRGVRTPGTQDAGSPHPDSADGGAAGARRDGED